MYLQLFYTLPSFISQWTDTVPLLESISSGSEWISSVISTESGTINPDWFINLNTLYIVVFQLLISTLVMKFKPINTMISGIFLCAIGLGLSFLTRNGSFLIISLFIFAVGEMSSSPKITEYIGRIAPKGKEALYMGMSFIPLSIGQIFAGPLSGAIYDEMSNKTFLLQKEMGIRGIDIPKISDSFTKNDYFNKACELTEMNPAQMTSFLWETYQPYNIWMVFSGIGLFTVICLFLYNKFILKGIKK